MTNEVFDYGNGMKVAGEDVIDEMVFETDAFRISNGIDQIGEPNGEPAAFQVERVETNELGSTDEHVYEAQIGVVTDDGFQVMDSYQFPVTDDFQAPETLSPQNMQEVYEFAGNVVDRYMSSHDTVDTVETGEPEGEYQSRFDDYGGSSQGELHFPLDEEEDDGIDVV